jgi:hypothetical protein
LGDKTEKNKVGGTCSMYWESRGVYMILVRKPEENRPIGKSRCTWEDNIKLDLQEVGMAEWTGSSWFRIGTGGGHL